MQYFFLIILFFIGLLAGSLTRPPTENSNIIERLKASPQMQKEFESGMKTVLGRAPLGPDTPMSTKEILIHLSKSEELDQENLERAQRLFIEKPVEVMAQLKEMILKEDGHPEEKSILMATLLEIENHNHEKIEIFREYLTSHAEESDLAALSAVNALSELTSKDAGLRSEIKDFILGLGNVRLTRELNLGEQNEQ